MNQSIKKHDEKISFTKLGAVVLTDPYAVNAMKKEREYLLDTLDADKLLYWFRRNASSLLSPLPPTAEGGKARSSAGILWGTSFPRLHRDTQT